MSEYPSIGDRVLFTYHGKCRVGTVEDTNDKYMTLEHFDTKTGRDYSNFRFDHIEEKWKTDRPSNGIVTL